MTPCRCAHQMSAHQPAFRGACDVQACDCRGFDVPTEAAPALLGYQEELRAPDGTQPAAADWMGIAAEARADLETLASRIGWTLGTVTMELRPHEETPELWLVDVSAPAWRDPSSPRPTDEELL